MTETREQLLVRTFVTLADSLVTDFDLIDLLQTLVDQCIELFDASAAGIILGPDIEHLEVMVSTSERSQLVEIMQLRTSEGPCVEAITTGKVVSVENTAEAYDRWPAFAAEAVDAGYVSVHAIPLRLRGQVLGSLNLFRDWEGALNEADAVAARGLADVATISTMQERAVRGSKVVADQLQEALNSRVLIEQAKGIVAQRHDIDMEAAFGLIRATARNRRIPVVLLSKEIIERRSSVTLNGLGQV